MSYTCTITEFFFLYHVYSSFDEDARVYDEERGDHDRDEQAGEHQGDPGDHADHGPGDGEGKQDPARSPPGVVPHTPYIPYMPFNNCSTLLLSAVPTPSPAWWRR